MLENKRNVFFINLMRIIQSQRVSRKMTFFFIKSSKVDILILLHIFNYHNGVAEDFFN